MAKIHATQCAKRLIETTAKGLPKGIQTQYEKLLALNPAIATGWLVDHKAAVVWARDLVSRPESWCANDTETTHFNEGAEVIEIAIIAGDKRTVLDQLVKPKKPPSSGTVKVHGIFPAMLAEQPTWSSLVPKINRLFAGFSEIVIYNAPFEQRLYEQTSFICGGGLVVLPPRITDPLRYAAAFIGEWDWAHNGWKYPKLEGGHRAAGDCIAMIDLIEIMASSPIDEFKP